MTKNKNNVYFLVLVLALAFILMPVLTQSVSADHQTKTIHITVVDDETGRRVEGARCTVLLNGRAVTGVSTNHGGKAKATFHTDATTATVRIFCNSQAAGSGDTLVPQLKENGATRATVIV